jgi:hypothetical protein
MDDLFALVEEYAAFGVHRSGTTTQLRTSRWLAGLLRERGAEVEEATVGFERYVAQWAVSIDGDDVEALPLFYEATGSTATDDPGRWPAFSPTGAGPMGVTGALSDRGTEAGDVVVAATQNLLGLLAVSNRTPAAGSGVHVLQVAGHHGGALAGGATVRASIDARVEASICHNIVARFGDAESSDRLVVVTTPISGWFTCAGERGTGVAAAVELAHRLSAETPVLFLGATGHELGAFGAVGFHERFGGRVDTVIHVGANVGCDWVGSAELDPPDHSYMAARFAGPADLAEPLSSVFAPTGHGLDTPARDRSLWFGEAAEWLDAPCLLSLLGQNPWFHTPTDVPNTSCTAARTEAVTDALTEAAFAIIGR